MSESTIPPSKQAYIQWSAKVWPLPITPHLDELCRNDFSKLTFLFITEEIKLNTIIVEGGYISGIPAKNMYKSKFTG